MPTPNETHLPLTDQINRMHERAELARAGVLVTTHLTGMPPVFDVDTACAEALARVEDSINRNVRTALAAIDAHIHYLHMRDRIRDAERTSTTGVVVTGDASFLRFLHYLSDRGIVLGFDGDTP